MYKGDNPFGPYNAKGDNFLADFIEDIPVNSSFMPLNLTNMLSIIFTILSLFNKGLKLKIVNQLINIFCLLLMDTFLCHYSIK